MLFSVIFSVLLFLLPTQLGRHFWPVHSFIFGLKIDYLSPTVYLQDLLIILLLIISFINNNKFFSGKKIYFYLIFYLFFIITNLYFSIDTLTSLFSWLRITILCLFGYLVYKNPLLVVKILNKVLPSVIIFEFLLGVSQVFLQSSVGGVFWLFGERSFNIFSAGIAKATWMGQVILRPYGTFSHPNSLAGFILICLILLIGKAKIHLIDKIAIVFGFVLLLLSFSRTVWLAICFLGIAFFIYKIFIYYKTKVSRFSFLYLFTLISLPLMGYFFSHTIIEKASFVNRSQLAQFSVSLIKDNPLFGVGSGNFILALSRTNLSWSWLYWLQPVHNIFLLITAETGLTGIIIFLFFLQKILFRQQFSKQTIVFPYFVALLSIIFTGMFDHYWLTLIQNQLLFAIILGVLSANLNGKINVNVEN